MEPVELSRRARITEIAELAGVGTSTVDRVINERTHVSKSTRQRVLQAKAAIESGSQTLKREKPWRLRVFLPGEAGPSTEFLAECFQIFGAKGNATIECVFTKKMEPAVLARKLRACAGHGIDAVAFQALEDPLVRDAIEELAHQNIPSVGLISPLDGSAMIGFVGIDNRAAGRTAGYLMGRVVRQPGSVAIFSGGQLYRGHEDREMGFRTALRQKFPHLKVVSTVAGNDDIDGNYAELRSVIELYPDLVGIYNVGGGNEGIVRALRDADVVGELLFIGHNLTPKTRAYLIEGCMDFVIHQNMHRAAEKTVETLIAHLEHRPIQSDVLPVEIITSENIIGATYG